MADNTKKQFLQGNIIAANAARAAGATHFFGYPITPSTEIFETWVKLVGDPSQPQKSPVTNENLSYLQCEDEMASGFALIGACMAGKKAFTATAGPGNILMQDAFAAAEALRVPTVALIMQRGGLSTSTVIYSQEEVTLTCLGGNGEGFRIVYSPSGLQELYDYTIKAFNSAWKYRYPAFVLADGYQAKMEGEIEMHDMPKDEYITPEPILLGSKRKQGISTNLRNCYDQEEEINDIIEEYRKDFAEITTEIAESESYKTDDAEILIIAHGIVATAAKAAIDMLRDSNIKAGLWRPITLRPLDTSSLLSVVKGKKTILFTESALGQLTRLINDEFGHSNTFCLDDEKNGENDRNDKNSSTKIQTLYKPAIGIAPKEIFDYLYKNEH